MAQKFKRHWAGPIWLGVSQEAASSQRPLEREGDLHEGSLAGRAIGPAVGGRLVPLCIDFLGLPTGDEYKMHSLGTLKQIYSQFWRLAVWNPDVCWATLSEGSRGASAASFLRAPAMASIRAPLPRRRITPVTASVLTVPSPVYMCLCPFSSFRNTSYWITGPLTAPVWPYLN